MISLSTNQFMIQSAAELPDLRGRDLFLDVETTSGDPKVAAFSPWHGHRILGFAFAVDDSPVYYVPMRHQSGNVPLQASQKYLRDLIQSRSTRWINHGIKFDAHFTKADGAEFVNPIVCTLTRAKLLETDRNGYALTELAQDLLKVDKTDTEAEVKRYLDKSKDWGVVPADIVGMKSTADVATNRDLFRWQESKRVEDDKLIWDIEEKFTAVLYDIEEFGMAVDIEELKRHQFKLQFQMLQLEEAIHKAAGFAINPMSSGDLFDLICNSFALPVLKYTEKKEPSFDFDSLTRYIMLVEDEDKKEVIRKVQKYRELGNLLGMFVESYLAKQADGILHPNYNQLVRTGRLSCSNPNAQQLNKPAKALIHPHPGYWFMCNDYSQLEFRLLVHYIQDAACIAAYAKDPDTDFHQWVAEMCRIPRDPAKNVNFGIGYGAGKDKTTRMLSTEPHIIEEMQKLATSPEHFKKLCNERAVEVYDTYHATLPGIKIKSREAQYRCLRRGHVFNAYGRRRYLPRKRAWKALNTICQGCGSDIMKDSLVKMSPRYNSWTREIGMKISGTVHDEALLSLPNDVAQDRSVTNKLKDIFEKPIPTFRVPMRISSGLSKDNWALASPKKNPI